MSNKKLYELRKLVDKIAKDNVSVESLVKMSFTKSDFDVLLKALNESLYDKNGALEYEFEIGRVDPYLIKSIMSVNSFVHDIYKLPHYEDIEVIWCRDMPHMDSHI